MFSKKKNHLLVFTFYLSISSTIFIIEQLIPKPFPFLRLGLANVVILILISEKEYWDAVGVSMGKSIVGAAIMGTLFTPTFILSLVSSFFSSFTMVVFYKFTKKFSLYGISIIGAIVHNVIQLYLVRVLLIRQNNIFRLTPLILFLSLLMGLLSACITYKIKERFNLNEEKKES